MKRGFQFGLLVLTFSSIHLMLRWDVFSTRLHRAGRPTEVQFVDLAFVLQEFWEDRMVLLDVRSEREYQAGHIKGALRLDPAKAENLPADKMLVTYCRDSMCGAAYVAARETSQKLNRKIYVYSGGLREWHNSRLPLAGGDTQ